MHDRTPRIFCHIESEHWLGKPFQRPQGVLPCVNLGFMEFQRNSISIQPLLLPGAETSLLFCHLQWGSAFSTLLSHLLGVNSAAVLLPCTSSSRPRLLAHGDLYSWAFPPWLRCLHPCLNASCPKPAVLEADHMTGAIRRALCLCSVSSVHFAQSCPTLCDLMDCSMPGLPVHHQLPKFTQAHVHWVSDTIQPSHPLSSPSPPPLNLSQHQGLFKWVNSSHQVAKVLEFQLQHQSFQRIFRTDFPWDGLVGSPCSPRDSQESSPTPQFKSINFSVLSFLYSPTLTSTHDYWKNHSPWLDGPLLAK